MHEGSEIVSVCPYPEKRNHLSFVNISPTLVIDTSMERFSRVLHHGNTKIFFLNFFYCVLTGAELLLIILASCFF